MEINFALSWGLPASLHSKPWSFLQIPYCLSWISFLSFVMAWAQYCASHPPHTVQVPVLPLIRCGMPSFLKYCFHISPLSHMARPVLHARQLVLWPCFNMSLVTAFPSDHSSLCFSSSQYIVLCVPWNSAPPPPTPPPQRSHSHSLRVILHSFSYIPFSPIMLIYVSNKSLGMLDCQSTNLFERWMELKLDNCCAQHYDWVPPNICSTCRHLHQCSKLWLHWINGSTPCAPYFSFWVFWLCSKLVCSGHWCSFRNRICMSIFI